MSPSRVETTELNPHIINPGAYRVVIHPVRIGTEHERERIIHAFPDTLDSPADLFIFPGDRYTSHCAAVGRLCELILYKMYSSPYTSSYASQLEEERGALAREILKLNYGTELVENNHGLEAVRIDTVSHGRHKDEDKTIICGFQPEEFHEFVKNNNAFHAFLGLSPIQQDTVLKATDRVSRMQFLLLCTSTDPEKFDWKASFNLFPTKSKGSYLAVEHDIWTTDTNIPVFVAVTEKV